MAMAQFTAPLYLPLEEFMNLVFTTSTGEATTVVQNPAAKAAVKWQGKSSAGHEQDDIALFYHTPLGGED